MKLELGSGPTLKELAPWIKDEAVRYERILDVTERDSIIEGLPPLEAETRRRILAQLQAIARAAASACSMTTINRVVMLLEGCLGSGNCITGIAMAVVS
jgi:hypothetical protein